MNIGIVGSGKVDILSDLQKAQDKMCKLILCNPKNEQALKEGLKNEFVYVVSEEYVEENKVIAITDEKMKSQMIETYRSIGKIK